MSANGFFERNRNLLIGAAVGLGVAGAALYYTQQVNQTVNPDVSESSKTQSKKKKSKKKAAKKDAKSEDAGSLYGFPLASSLSGGPKYPVIDGESDIESKLKQLSETQRKELADQLKTAGNNEFKNQNNEAAVKLYGQAIQIVDSDPTFYANRAAAEGVLEHYEEVIRDTTKALELRPDYVKCYSRRGVAYEKLGNYSEAGLDYTAACILSNFEDDALARSIDRVLKLLAEKINTEKYSGPRPEQFPSPTFISAFLMSFHNREIPESVQNATDESTGEYLLKQAFDAMDKGNLESYKLAFDLLKKSVEKGASSDDARAAALEHLATFKYLLNDLAGALKDIEASLKLRETSSSYVKCASFLIEDGKLSESLENFNKAQALDPNSADVNYQLGQLAFIQQNWDAAIQQYEKAVELDDTFLLAKIQLAVSKYRKGDTDASVKLFEDALEKTPDNSQLHTYFGEVLLDLKDFDGANKQFDLAVELENKKAAEAVNVLPLINKAMACLSKDNSPATIQEAVSYCRKAVAIDPASDVAVGTLAQLCLQSNQTEEAIRLFEQNADLSRTDAERIQNLTFAEAAKAQIRIATERPVIRQRMELLTRYGNNMA